MKSIIFKLLLLLFNWAITSAAFAQWTTSGNDISNSNTGNVGIGTSSPSTKLHVNGDVTMDGGLVKFINNWTGGSLVGAGSFGTTSIGGLQIRAKAGSVFDFGFFDPAGNTYLLAYNGSTNLSFGGDIVMGATRKLWLDGNTYTYMSATSANVISIVTNNTERLKINESGQVGIGVSTVPTGYKFAVAGNIIAEKVRVKLQSAGWPDYVFNKDYKLPGLKEVEEFIKINNHLPGVPSAEQIGKEGLDLGHGQAVLLKKIEELTLYVIDLNKRVARLENENDDLKKKIKTE